MLCENIGELFAHGWFVQTNRRDRPVTDVRIISIKVDPESMPADPVPATDSTTVSTDTTAKK